MEKNFDVVMKIRELDRRMVALESVQPFANMDAGGRGANMAVLANKRLQKVLIAAGYDTVEKVCAASDQELRAVDGVGPATLKLIREAIG